MVINFRQLCSDYNIEVGLPHTCECYREGWVNVRCSCGDTGFRLGYSEDSGFFHCFRCGGKSVYTALHDVMGIPYNKVGEIVKHYTVGSNRIIPRAEIEHSEFCNLPEGTTTLKKPHGNYLRSRDFIAKDLVDKWDLQATTGVGNYAMRIIAPIYYKGVLCSYQGRDITGIAKLRYKACTQKDEVIQHKHLLYGFDHAKPYKACVVVEGITDVWRLGYGAVATFGIKWTPHQMRLLANNFETVYIAYDSVKDTGHGTKEERQAQEAAKELCDELTFRGVNCSIISIGETDPGDMDQGEANTVMEKLGFYDNRYRRANQRGRT